jgi:glycosyltransferase involved in cell wall biosynthesis
LVIKVMNGDADPERLAALRRGQAAGALLLIEERLSRGRLLDLMRCADVFLSLHRAEGFGLAPAEAMALGVPVVATDWSATAEYLDATVGWPVPYQLEPIGRETTHYTTGQRWAEADVAAAARCLVQIFADLPAARQRAALGAARIAERYAPAAVGQRILTAYAAGH